MTYLELKRSHLKHNRHSTHVWQGNPGKRDTASASLHILAWFVFMVLGTATVVPLGGVAGNVDETPSTQLGLKMAYENSAPLAVRVWRSMFNLLFLNWTFILVQTLVVNLLRALCPQHKDFVYASYPFLQPHAKHNLSRMQSVVLTLRNVSVELYIMVILGLVLVRYIASRTSFVMNRTRMITSGRDTLMSLLITVSCMAVFYTAVCPIFLTVAVPMWLLDFRRHKQVYPSFGPADNPHYTYADAFLMIMCVTVTLNAAIGHLNRYEVLSEAELMAAGVAVGKPVLRSLQWRRRVSAASLIACVALVYLDKHAAYFLPLFRTVTCTCIVAVVAALASSFSAALRFLWGVVHDTGKDLKVEVKRHGLFAPPSCELRWVDRTEHGPMSWISFCKQVLALVLWHAGSRSLIASMALILYAANLLPLLPAVQLELYAAFALLSVFALLYVRLLQLNYPSCMNASGADIPPVHVGFGMLVEKGQLLRVAVLGATSCSRMKMVPATVERLAEAVTISYRWDDNHRFPLQIWNRDPAEEAHASRSMLSRAFAMLAAHGIAVHDRSLVWLDKASIDQQSDAFMKMLVPKMAACYALSECTLVLDNSHQCPVGTPDNYFSRTWTFQEYCLPPTLATVQVAGAPSQHPDEDLRAAVQLRFWRAPTMSPAFQPFSLIWIDTPAAIKHFLVKRPDIVKEYLHAAETRVGLYSRDRFAAIMQTVSGVMCFTPEGINQLKRIMLEVIAERPADFEGCAVLDNTGWDAQCSGCATWDRILAGRPCPGDKAASSFLTLTGVRRFPSGQEGGASEPSSTADEPWGTHHMLALCGTYVAVADDGDATVQRTGEVQLRAAPLIPITAVLDQDSRVVVRLSVAPAAGAAGGPQKANGGAAGTPAALEPAGPASDSLHEAWIQMSGSQCIIHAV